MSKVVELNKEEWTTAWDPHLMKAWDMQKENKDRYDASSWFLLIVTMQVITTVRKRAPSEPGSCYTASYLLPIITQGLWQLEWWGKKDNFSTDRIASLCRQLTDNVYSAVENKVIDDLGGL